jgi:NTP pyrophosphatase (non-canonical NTP hydrolase)
VSLSFEQLRQVNAVRGVEWNKGNVSPDDILFRAVELGGEAGEVCNAVKKLMRFKAGMVGGKDFAQSHADIAKELADVVICADHCAEALNIDLGQAVKDKFNETSAKYGLQTKF